MASQFDPSAYGFQDTGDGRLFVPFSSTKYGQTQPEGATSGEGNDPNPNAGKYALTTQERGGNNDPTTNYYSSLADYYNAVNKADFGGTGTPSGPDLSNIRYEAGTNNPSHLSYNTRGMTPEQLAGLAGQYRGQLGYTLDPRRMGYIESSPGSAWNDFRGGALPVFLAAAGGALGAGSGAAAEGSAGGAAGGAAGEGAAAGNVAQGLQLTGSTSAEGMGGGTGLTAAGSGEAAGMGAQGLQLSSGTASALGAGFSPTLSNFGNYSSSSTEQGLGSGLQMSPSTSQTLGVPASGGTTGGAGAGAGGTPAAGASPAGGSGQSLIDSIIEQMKKNAVPLGLAALSAAQGSRQQDMPNHDQMNAGGNAASGLGTDYINAARAGNLMPWQQSGLEQYTQQAKNQINQYFASIGQFDSTARMQALAQVDQQAQVMKGQLLQQTLSSGLSALGASQGPFNTIANYQLQQDRRLQDAMGNFARSVGSLYGTQAGKPTSTTPQQPTTGGQVNTNPQPYIPEQTPQNIQGNP